MSDWKVCYDHDHIENVFKRESCAAISFLCCCCFVCADSEVIANIVLCGSSTWYYE